MTNGKIARLQTELKIDIPDLDKLEIQHRQKIKFTKEKLVIKNNNKITISPPQDISCIYCGSLNFIKCGNRYNKNYKVQKFTCKNPECNRKFSFKPGFKRMSVDAKVISQTIQLYFSGVSLRDTASFLRMQGIMVTHAAVYGWIKKYVKLMKVFVDQFTPQVSDNWRCDEIYVKIKGEPKYLFALMDDQTRFILAYYIADKKKTHNASKLLQMAQAKAGKKPKVFTTDGLHSYKKAFKEEWWSPVENIEHIVGKYSDGTKWKNNMMERWNATYRKRQKTLGGLKKRDSVTIDGFMLYYNFIREHTALKSTPAQKAGIVIKGDKWLTLIQNATGEQKVG